MDRLFQPAFLLRPQCVLNFSKVSIVESSKVKRVAHRQECLILKNVFFLYLPIYLKHMPLHNIHVKVSRPVGVIALHNLSLRNGTQAYWIGGKHLYQWTHLTNPYISYSETLAYFLYLRCLTWFSECDLAYWSSERLNISSRVSQLNGGKAGCKTEPRKEEVTVYNMFVTPCGIKQKPVTRQGYLPWCSRWDPREAPLWLWTSPPWEKWPLYLFHC